MAGDYESFQRDLLNKIAVNYALPFELFTAELPGLSDAVWYQRIGARLDALPDDGCLFVARFQLPWHPGRYVWIDRHLRVWRSDDRGRLTTRENLRT